MSFIYVRGRLVIVVFSGVLVFWCSEVWSSLLSDRPMFTAEASPSSPCRASGRCRRGVRERVEATAIGDGLEPVSQIIIDDDDLLDALVVVQTALEVDENLAEGEQKGLVLRRWYEV
ncbi:hypothetical protein AS593_07000 [Caulobacter vibrioides]|nr:hypothetical protein AS593_07000 [Caulobacter vibrioides]